MAIEKNSGDPSIQRLEREMRQLTLRLNSTNNQLTAAQKDLATVNGIVNVLQHGQSQTPPAPVANMLLNGEFGHSVNSWNDSSYTTDDKSKECAWFFSHFGPFVPIEFDAGDVDLTANSITFDSAHGMVTGHAVRLAADDPPPTPLVLLTTYYAIYISPTAIKLATTLANALASTPIDLTAASGGPFRLQPHLDSTDARTSSTNFALKRSEGTHTKYNISFSDWYAVSGWGRLNGLATIDTPVPNNFLEPGMTAYIGLRAARRNSYIEIPDDALMFAGVADNTDGQGDFLEGSVGLTATASINGASTVERRYRLYVQTDRGYSILSPEVTVAGAPDDGQYNATNFVQLAWHQVAGYLNVQIWMYTPGTGVYRLVEETSSGTSTFIDNGAFVRTDSGYPTATTTTRKALFYTRTGELADLAVDPADWDTITFPALVPDNYNKALTTDRQWVRLGMTGACNLLIEGCTADGSTSQVTAPAAVFEAVYDAFYADESLHYELYDANDVLSYQGAIEGRSSTTVILLEDTPATGTYTLRVVGGGFHGIVVDKIHLGLQRNVSFAPNANDARTLQPVAAPSTGQGTGGGDPGGGGVLCVAADEPVEMADDTWAFADELHKGNYVIGEHLAPNLVVDNTAGLKSTRIVKMANGIKIRATDTQPFRLTKFDNVGAALRNLRVGDNVMTRLDGRNELSRIVSISPLGELVKVRSPRLQGGHYYCAGAWCPKWWERWLIALKLKRVKCGGVYLHNRKPRDLDP